MFLLYLLIKYYSLMYELGIEITAIFFLLSFIFFVSGLVLILKLKRHVRAFYVKVKGTIWLATIILSVSLLIRAVLNLIRSFTNL